MHLQIHVHALNNCRNQESLLRLQELLLRKSSLTSANVFLPLNLHFLSNLIERLTGVPDGKRTARFVCCVAAAFPDRKTEVVRGTIEGRIGYKEEGENGFGYDPIFYVPEYGCTTASMSSETKNAISHRGKALQLIKPVIGAYLDTKGI